MRRLGSMLEFTWTHMCKFISHRTALRSARRYIWDNLKDIEGNCLKSLLVTGYAAMHAEVLLNCGSISYHLFCLFLCLLRCKSTFWVNPSVSFGLSYLDLCAWLTSNKSDSVLMNPNTVPRLQMLWMTLHLWLSFN